MLFLRLPRAAAGRLTLVVPGDVEIRSGLDVAGRTLDRAAGVTRFELLPAAGDATLVMSLNSHLQRREQAVIARSVLVDEVTAACEKLYATVSLAILYRAVDHFRFVVPEGFEITEINSPLLSRWDVKVENRRKIANVRLPRADHRDGGAEHRGRARCRRGWAIGSFPSGSRWTWKDTWRCWASRPSSR